MATCTTAVDQGLTDSTSLPVEHTSSMSRDDASLMIGKDHHRQVGDSFNRYKALHHPLPITHPITKVNHMIYY